MRWFTLYIVPLLCINIINVNITTYNFVAHMPIDKQRLSKHIPEVTVSTTEHPLLGNGPINTHS
jgi:hypothetical protein